MLLYCVAILAIYFSFSALMCCIVSRLLSHSLTPHRSVERLLPKAPILPYARGKTGLTALIGCMVVCPSNCIQRRFWLRLFVLPLGNEQWMRGTRLIFIWGLVLLCQALAKQSAWLTSKCMYLMYVKLWYHLTQLYDIVTTFIDQKRQKHNRCPYVSMPRFSLLITAHTPDICSSAQEVTSQIFCF